MIKTRWYTQVKHYSWWMFHNMLCKMETSWGQKFTLSSSPLLILIYVLYSVSTILFMPRRVRLKRNSRLHQIAVWIFFILFWLLYCWKSPPTKFKKKNITSCSCVQGDRNNNIFIFHVASLTMMATEHSLKKLLFELVNKRMELGY